MCNAYFFCLSVVDFSLLTGTGHRPLALQVAHVHVQDPSDIPLVRQTLEALDGVEKVMDAGELDAYYREKGKNRREAKARGTHHLARSGELVAVADASSWFAYYYWTEDSMAPDFARCVAIHRKPGYDPAEMFFRFPGFMGFAWLLWKLFLVYGLRLRMIVDGTPLRCDAIKGSHGRLPDGDDDPRPLVMFKRRLAEAEGGKEAGFAGVQGVKELGREECIREEGSIVAEDVYEVLWRVLMGKI